MDISNTFDKYKLDRAKRVLHQTPMAIAVTVMNSLILVLLLIGSTPFIRLVIWLSAVLMINVIRIFGQYRMHKTAITPDNVNQHLKIFLVALTVSGAIWGSAGVYLLPASSIAHQVFIVLMLGGMVAGTVGLFSSVMAAFYCFTIPASLPVGIVFFLYGDSVHFAMGVMIFLFWVVMFVTAKKLNRELIEAISLKYENVGLIATLEKEVGVRKAAEEKLIQRNSEIESIVERRTAELINANKQLLREIEERKEAVNALKRSEQKYRELANSLPQIVFETDEAGNITFANRNAIRAFGYEASDLEKGINLYQLIIPSDREKMRENFQKNIQGIMKTGNEYTALRKDGSTFPVLSHADIVKKDVNKIGIIGIAIDLTDKINEERKQREMEAQLQRAQKMEALGTLAGGVAHDLNNILSGIVGYPDLLLMQLPQDSPFRKPVITMQDSGKKAAAIVQDLLTLTRRNVIVDKTVNLNDIINEYLGSLEFEKLISYHNSVKIRTRLEEGLLNIKGSPIHLLKTVMNLVSNAAEALPDGGDIIISTENRYLDQPLRGYDDVAQGDYAVMRVCDNGTGISPNDIGRIFEPFFTKKSMGKSGTGLGMTVVWGTVKDHNGYIDVKSAVNRGTEFTLFFPVTRAEIDLKEKEEGLTPFYGRGESVLIVDDVKSQIDIAYEMLEQLGYSVSSVTSGEEAIEFISDHKADLIVLDMIMQPGIDGLETYKRILKINPKQKAIIASGFAETIRVKSTMSLGAGAYIKKPYTLITLAKAVRAELDRV
ncbi:MAG: PAS domain S-box protein [Deltaproteobacteria bacterium]|nr:PAS domain S-box protein [Deltaproteobacteria bacterium]